MIPPHYGIRMVLHPYPGQRIATDLIVLKHALCKIRDVQPHVLAIADVAMAHMWVGVQTGNTYCRAHDRGAADDAVVDGRAAVVRGFQRVVLVVRDRRANVRTKLKNIKGMRECLSCHSG